MPRDSSNLLAVDLPGCPSAGGLRFLMMSYPSTTLFTTKEHVWEFLSFAGVSRTLVGIGADAAPVGQRPGPILSPWADYRTFTSELEFPARTRTVIVD